MSTMGLQYAFADQYSPGARIVVDGRAILFSTDGPQLADTSTSVKPEPIIPTDTYLYPNFPNPFNPSTEIRFDLPQTAQTELKVYNIRGQVVTTLVDEVVPAGVHQVSWNGKDSFGRAVASGVYIYTLRTPGFQDARKMLLIK
ncbi:MAG: T9SS type A sorting domain-containing protein [bacterium]|nr:T9SS type A sorting domain-containing protein [bacterium]